VELLQSTKLSDVCYDIRGPVLEEAKRLEASGRSILKLNIGNPAAFGLVPPDELMVDLVSNLPSATGYSDSQGILSARVAVAQHYQDQGVLSARAEHVWLGNGVSELIVMAMQALLNDGDEVLIPAPDYPLWTAAVTLSGGRAVHYRCDESNGWMPDIDDIRAKAGPATKAIVVINPNNPTGAVYSKELLEEILQVAREHSLVLCSDEIYDKILYDDAEHHAMSTLSDDVFTLTFNGLSKAYRAAGFRSGWLLTSGPRAHARSYLEGLSILANMRLCANVPAQHVIQAALGGHQSVRDLILPGGRLRDQRDAAMTALEKIPGVSCVKPAGALYLFPRLDPEVYPIVDDEAFVMDLLRAKHVLVVQGTGFNWFAPDHFRIVTLPRADELTDAIERIGDFLSTYRPGRPAVLAS
jgi:alanine-synthesizing transaminase